MADSATSFLFDLDGTLVDSVSPVGPHTSRSLEPCRIINRRLEAERGDRADARHGHEAADLHIMTRQLQNLTLEIADLLLDGLARRE